MQDGRYFESMQLRSDAGAQGWVPLSIVTASADFGGVKPAIIFLHATGAAFYDDRLQSIGSALQCHVHERKTSLKGPALPSLSARSVHCTATSTQHPPSYLLSFVAHAATLSPGGARVQAQTRRACSSAWCERQALGS